MMCLPRSNGCYSNPAISQHGKRGCGPNIAPLHGRIARIRSCSTSIRRRRTPNYHLPETPMSAFRPRSRLETHDVSNQPPPLEDVNLFTSDAALQAAVSAAGGEVHGERLSAFGARAGS